MSIRGLVVALLCGLLGLGGGALVAYAVQPHPASAGTATPVKGVSPSVPTDVPTVRPYAPDIDYPPLSPDLALPVVHTIKNRLATWTYHVPEGWAAYSVCTAVLPNVCKVKSDTPVPPKRIDQVSQVRFRPPDEPLLGGYSLRVRVLDNALAFNIGLMVGSKVIGFRQTYTEFHVLKKTESAVYFTYRDELNHLRYNYFQWFAVPGSPTATLEMSVSGRKVDAPGLQALFNRFADNATSG